MPIFITGSSPDYYHTLTVATANRRMYYRVRRKTTEAQDERRRLVGLRVMLPIYLAMADFTAEGLERYAAITRCIGNRSVVRHAM